VRRALAAALLSALLGACATSPYNAAGLQSGTARNEVLARLGPPTRVVPIAGGERLQYSLQPFGRQAWMVDLDASGRVVRTRQVLSETELGRIVPAQWTREDVEREFGPPAHIQGVSSWNGPVLTYLWRDLANSNMFWWVYLDERGVVQRAHPGMEFINAPNERS
jgi:hypothetical protein